MVTISRKLFYFLAFLFVFSIISSLGHANGQTVFGPKDCKIKLWHIHASSHSFKVNDPGDGLIIIAKNTPNKKIQTGFIILNWRFIGIEDFLSTGDTVFEKDISLKSENNLAVFLIGTPEASITIEIRKKSTSPPPEVTFSADPSSIKLGESSTLSWATTNADGVSIDQGIGSLSLSGSLVVSPQETTTYILMATGLGGTTTKSTTVNVYLSPTVNITADPKTIEIGSASTLTWSSTNANSVTIDQGIGSVDFSGTATVLPTETTTYTIIVSGPGGTAMDFAVVAVIAPPDDVNHGLDTDEQQAGGGLVGETIRILNGNMVEYRADLLFSSPNRLGLSLRAVYNSRSNTLSSMGYGWTYTYEVSLDPGFVMGSSLYLKIVDQTGRAHYFEEAGGGLYAGVFNERTHVMAEAGGYVWHQLDGTKYAFSASGQLTWMDDSSGNRLELAYDTNNRLEAVTDISSGRILTFHYNADGRLTSITGPITDAVPSGTWVTYGYDANQNLTSMTYADHSGFTYTYTDPNDVHNLTENRDNAGHLLNTWAYDDQDRATDNFSLQGKGVSINYVNETQVDVTDAYSTLRTHTIGDINGRKRVSAISGAIPGGAPYSNSNAVSWIYDTSMRPTEVEYAGGTIIKYLDYDAKGNPGTIKLAYNTPEERIITYTYHPDMNTPLTRIEASVLGSGTKETIWDYDNDYDPVPNEEPTNLLSRIIEKGFTKDISGNIIPYEYITTFTHNSRGQVLSINGPLPGNGDTTSFTYDQTTGNLLSITRPLIGATSFSNYDAAGQVGLATDINNQSKGFTYDGRGRVTLITNNTDGSTNSVIYNTAGLPVSRTDEDGVIKSFLYDTLYGRLVRTTDHVGNYISYDYDLQGNMIEKSYHDHSDSRTNWKRYTYQDPAHNMPGKLYKEINPDNTFTKYGYDSEGNVASVTDPNNNIASYEYDPFNRLITVTQPGNAVTSYSYDAHSNLKSVTDAESHTTTYEYDDMGRLLSTTSPDTGTVTYVYDEAGNPLSKTDAKGITVGYEYDLLNRLTDLNFPDFTQDITYIYDTGANGMGRHTGMIDPSGSMTFGYDTRGRLIEKTSIINSQSYTVSQSFTLGSRISSVTYPTVRTIDYDRTTCACSVDAVSTTYNGDTIILADNLSYRPFGIAKGMNTGAGGTVNNEFDLSGRLTVANPGTNKEKIYTYDNNGSLTSVTAPNTPWYNRTYTYDALNRLDHAEGPYGIIDYTYDAVGNRLTKVTNGIIDTYAYITDTNKLNEISGTETIPYTYDANGNITNIGSKILTYNQNNRLIRVEENGTTLGEYTYNGLGQRVIKEVDGVTTMFHYDFNGNIIAESDLDGNFTKEYLYKGKGRSALVDVSSGKIYYFCNDRLGTPQILTDLTNTVVWEGIYKPFGKAEVNPNSSVVNNFRFAGQYYDEKTGLHYNWNRYYDSKTGRYLTPDPLGIEKGKNHLFVYAENNPINSTDLMGLKTGWGFGGSLGIFGGSTDEFYDTCCYKGRLLKRTIAKHCWHMGITLSAKIKLPNLLKFFKPTLDSSNNFGNCGKREWVSESEHVVGGDLIIYGRDTESGNKLFPFGLGGYYKLYEQCRYIVTKQIEIGCCNQ
jgi:RHS repeat-associated protein